MYDQIDIFYFRLLNIDYFLRTNLVLSLFFSRLQPPPSPDLQRLLLYITLYSFNKVSVFALLNLLTHVLIFSFRCMWAQRGIPAHSPVSLDCVRCTHCCLPTFSSLIFPFWGLQASWEGWSPRSLITFHDPHSNVNIENNRKNARYKCITELIHYIQKEEQVSAAEWILYSVLFFKRKTATVSEASCCW